MKFFNWILVVFLLSGPIIAYSDIPHLPKLETVGTEKKLIVGVGYHGADLGHVPGFSLHYEWPFFVAALQRLNRKKERRITLREFFLRGELSLFIYQNQEWRNLPTSIIGYRVTRSRGFLLDIQLGIGAVLIQNLAPTYSWDSGSFDRRWGVSAGLGLRNGWGMGMNMEPLTGLPLRWTLRIWGHLMTPFRNSLTFWPSAELSIEWAFEGIGTRVPLRKLRNKR